MGMGKCRSEFRREGKRIGERGEGTSELHAKAACIRERARDHYRHGPSYEYTERYVVIEEPAAAAG